MVDNIEVFVMMLEILELMKPMLIIVSYHMATEACKYEPLPTFLMQILGVVQTIKWSAWVRLPTLVIHTLKYLGAHL